MNINRHNYEEFFILYLDNELNADQRRLVEEFVQSHPDLKEELDSLLQYKLIPDESVVFPAKEELLKGEESIPMANYRETLLLYIDNELELSKRIAVEQLLATNESLRNEYEKLMRTRLEPEFIAFPDKSLLYRRTERRIPAVWWRMAAAVLILGLILTPVLLINRQPSATPPVANVPSKNDQQKVVRTEEQRNIGTEEQRNKEQRNDEVKEEKIVPLKQTIQPKQDLMVNNQNIRNNEKNEVKIQEIKTPAEIVSPKNNNETLADNNNLKPSNNLPQPQKDAIALQPKEDNKNPNALTEAGVTNPDRNPSIIQTGATDQEFAQNGNNGKKSKLRGFFRKIARTFEKRTNIDPTTDDNKLLVAGLSLNLK